MVELKLYEHYWANNNFYNPGIVEIYGRKLTRYMQYGHFTFYVEINLAKYLDDHPEFTLTVEPVEDYFASPKLLVNAETEEQELEFKLIWL